MLALSSLLKQTAASSRNTLPVSSKYALSTIQICGMDGYQYKGEELQKFSFLIGNDALLTRIVAQLASEATLG